MGRRGKLLEPSCRLQQGSHGWRHMRRDGNEGRFASERKVRLLTIGRVNLNRTPCSMLSWVRATCSARGGILYHERKRMRPPPPPRQKHPSSRDRRSCLPESVWRRCRWCRRALTTAEQQTSARAARSACLLGFRGASVFGARCVFGASELLCGHGAYCRIPNVDLHAVTSSL